jgi:hypothetical protein
MNSPSYDSIPIANNVHQKGVSFISVLLMTAAITMMSLVALLLAFPTVAYDGVKNTKLATINTVKNMSVCQSTQAHPNYPFLVRATSPAA